MKSSPQDKVKLDTEKMVREINAIVNNDWGLEIDTHSMKKDPSWTQKQSDEMAAALMKIYQIAHCISCRACQGKYTLPTPKSRKRSKV